MSNELNAKFSNEIKNQSKNNSIYKQECRINDYKRNLD